MQAMATYHGQAAAFGRLCVETFGDGNEVDLNPAAAFGRLCVETSQCDQARQKHGAAAFGRLCVETPKARPRTHTLHGSRLRAAVC